MKRQSIKSLTNPKVKQVVKLRESRTRRQTGLFIAEGLREIERAARAGLGFEQVWISDALLSERIVSLGLGDEVAWYEVPGGVFEKMAYVREPEGILAVIRQPNFGLEDLIQVERVLLLVAVGTQKPGNLGAMIRTADAAGCSGVLAAGAAVDVMNPNAIRTSTGAVFSLPVVNLEEAAAMAWLDEMGFTVLASSVDRDSVSYLKACYDAARLAIVIGPEDRGLDSSWYELAATTASGGGGKVTIPMRARVADSLNASTSAGVLLFEAMRSRA